MRTPQYALVSALLLLAPAAFAQKAEAFGHYSYMQFNPTINGLNSRALNGGGGGMQLNIGKILAVKGEFNGYMSTQTTVNVTSPIGTSAGIIPVGTYQSNSTMFQYLVGPVVQAPLGKVRPFGEVLFGQTITQLYADLRNQTIAGGVTTGSKDQNPFTMAFGGGLDVNVNKHIGLRLAQCDWVLTRFTNPWTSTNNQNSFRYQGGIIFRFGAE